MKITRFVQSCLLIEDSDSRIVIDPSGEEVGNDFGKLDAVLYTHEHGDHFDPELTKKIMGAGVPVYANASNAKLIDGQPHVVQNGEEFNIGSFKIKVLQLPHCPMPNGSAGPQNIGYLINQKLFHAGDGTELSGLQVDNLAAAITGPDISMRDAFDFAKQVGAKIVIPIHYDKLGAKPEVYKTFAGYFPELTFTLSPLAHGESMEI